MENIEIGLKTLTQSIPRRNHSKIASRKSSQTQNGENGFNPENILSVVAFAERWWLSRPLLPRQVFAFADKWSLSRHLQFLKNTAFCQLPKYFKRTHGIRSEPYIHKPYMQPY